MNPTDQEIDDFFFACSMLNMKSKERVRFTVRHFLSQEYEPTPKVEYCWECNECGSQEYSMSVSEDDVHALGCGACGQSEWHKAVSKS